MQDLRRLKKLPQILKKSIDKPKGMCYNSKCKGKVNKMKKDKPTIDRRMFKKEGEELQQYLHFRKRGSVVKNKKGKGSYNRQEFKKS